MAPFKATLNCQRGKHKASYFDGRAEEKLAPSHSHPPSLFLLFKEEAFRPMCQLSSNSFSQRFDQTSSN